MPTHNKWQKANMKDKIAKIIVFEKGRLHNFPSQISMAVSAMKALLPWYASRLANAGFYIKRANASQKSPKKARCFSSDFLVGPFFQQAFYQLTSG